jgi:hypothetical protein
MPISDVEIVFGHLLLRDGNPGSEKKFQCRGADEGFRRGS